MSNTGSLACSVSIKNLGNIKTQERERKKYLVSDGNESIMLVLHGPLSSH